MWSFEECQKATAQSRGVIDIETAADPHESTIFTAGDLDFQRAEARTVVAEQWDWFLSLARSQEFARTIHASVLNLVLARRWPLSIGRQFQPYQVLAQQAPTAANPRDTIRVGRARIRADEVRES
jgi:hypothetical protein